MSYMGNRNGVSICVDNYVKPQKAIDVDVDKDGDPYSYMTGDVAFWFKSKDIEPEWWFDDLNDVWFEFDNRGEGLLFILDCLKRL